MDGSILGKYVGWSGSSIDIFVVLVIKVSMELGNHVEGGHIGHGRIL